MVMEPLCTICGKSMLDPIPVDVGNFDGGVKIRNAHIIERGLLVLDPPVTVWLDEPGRGNTAPTNLGHGYIRHSLCCECHVKMHEYISYAIELIKEENEDAKRIMRESDNDNRGEDQGA